MESLLDNNLAVNKLCSNTKWNHTNGNTFLPVNDEPLGQGDGIPGSRNLAHLGSRIDLEKLEISVRI